MAGHGLLEAEALYVSAEGEDVSTSLGELAGERVVHGRPVRRIRSFAGQRHYPGLFWSATTGGHIGYESLLELDRLWLADFDPRVKWLASQPLWLSGMDGSTRRRHVPDLLLKLLGGGFVLVDVKPEKFAALPEVAAVFDWTGRLAAAKGWRYEVWSGAPETLLANVRWLAVGRRVELVDPRALEVVAEVGLSGMTIAEICAAASSSGVAELLVKPAV
ncbi:MAG: TnsA-like heteromeric transposase endonuclease subunit, partial [Actinomycetota bacterium]|nr:TnsA-like heteromeric transposase endonuclease subunit [Actinomycetota bacterium]